MNKARRKKLENTKEIECNSEEEERKRITGLAEVTRNGVIPPPLPPASIGDGVANVDERCSEYIILCKRLAHFQL